jgi:hypothetical protein
VGGLQFTDRVPSLEHVGQAPQGSQLPFPQHAWGDLKLSGELIEGLGLLQQLQDVLGFRYESAAVAAEPTLQPLCRP